MPLLLLMVGIGIGIAVSRSASGTSTERGVPADAPSARSAAEQRFVTAVITEPTGKRYVVIQYVHGAPMAVAAYDTQEAAHQYIHTIAKAGPAFDATGIEAITSVDRTKITRAEIEKWAAHDHRPPAKAP